jgi:hypothetical protein
MWRRGNLKRDRLVEEASAGNGQVCKDGTKKEEDGVRGLKEKEQKLEV